MPQRALTHELGSTSIYDSTGRPHVTQIRQTGAETHRKGRNLSRFSDSESTVLYACTMSPLTKLVGLSLLELFVEGRVTLLYLNVMKPFSQHIEIHEPD